MLKNSLKGIGVFLLLVAFMFYFYSYKEYGGCVKNSEYVYDCSVENRVIFVTRNLSNSILLFVGCSFLFTIGFFLDNKKSLFNFKK